MAARIVSFQFVVAIKMEVVLSFLGLGPQGQPSWGVMIDDSRMELSRGVWWQRTAAGRRVFRDSKGVPSYACINIE